MDFAAMKSIPVWIYFLFGLIGGFAILTLTYYPGEGYVYVVFTIALNVYLYLGLRPGSLFFDTFLGVFMWLGFWMKFSLGTVVSDGRFVEAVGYFDYSPAAYDRTLLVTTCGIGGLVLARWIRQRLMFRSVTSFRSVEFGGIQALYNRYRNWIWAAFLVLVVAVSLSNLFFGIYQRGSVPRTVLPYGLGGIYTWLLLFGAASISATLLRCELTLREKIPYILILLVLMETFLSNVSMLSRGMILNASALLFGTYIAARAIGITLRLRIMVLSLMTLLVLFAASFYLVSEARSVFFQRKAVVGESLPDMNMSRARIENVALRFAVLFIDRWVGVEGVMAVSSYPNLGWDLWGEVWGEKYADTGTSFYDRTVSLSAYKDRDLSEHHFVSIPGILGFLFYPGSYAFLFLGMLAFGLMGALVELGTYKWGGGNLILCSLIGLVVAYRYVHFGYVPARSYLLFGSIVLNILLIYMLARVSAYRTLPDNRM